MYTLNSYVNVDLGSRNIRFVHVSMRERLNISPGLEPRKILRRACLNDFDKPVFLLSLD